MIKLSEISLADLLPSSIRQDPTVLAAAQAIDTELKQLTAAIGKINYYSRINELDSVEIDELAWQWHVDFYDPALPLEQRRALVKNSYAWHRRKGTPSTVEELIQTIFGDGEVQEWWEYDGDPYTFRVVTSNPSVSDEQADRFLAALNSVKNARSHLDSIQVTASDEMPVYVGFAVHTGDHITIRQVNS